MSDTPQDAWFFSKDGKQHGPVTTEELRFLAANSQLHPRQDLVWSHGMDEWKPAGEIDGLFEKVVAEAPPESSMATTPNLNLSSQEDTADELMGQQNEWPGIARGGYFLGSIALSLIGTFLPPYVAPYLSSHPQTIVVIPVLLGFASFILLLSRLANTGMSRWWFLGFLIPIVNLWVGFRVFAAPPGYVFHRKMDAAGIFLGILYWLFVILPVLAVVVALVIVLFTDLGDPELRKKFLDILHQAQTQIQAKASTH